LGCLEAFSILVNSDFCDAFGPAAALERKLMESWRFSQPTVDSPTKGYQRLFEGLFKELYGEGADLSAYFDEAQIQHAPQYSYGEQIAILEERAAWAFDKLPVIEQWFEQMQPVLREEGDTAKEVVSRNI